MDARAEAEKRYPREVHHDGMTRLSGTALSDRANFLAGAAWALREFGDMLDVEATNGEWSAERDLALMSYASEAHRIADEIAEGGDGS